MIAPNLNVLVLHYLGDPRTWRASMVEKELCLPMFAPGHNYIVHNAALPLPEFVKDIEFDGIVLTQTFLGRRRHKAVLRRVLEEYSFVGASPAFKIALPQDDYHCSAILDRWLVDWKVDLTYPVVAEHWDVLYPLYTQTGRLRLGYTGYVSDRMIDRWQSPRPIEARTIDVSYRASKLPPTHGRLGYLKGVIGDRFAAKVRGRGLTLDISTDPKDVIFGAAWQAFLEESKFVLGSNSGVSLHDPDGVIQEAVVDYVVRHPQATFEQVEAACFPALDGKYEFTAISPRNIECGLIQSVQILTPGKYSGMLAAGEHYIELDPEMANIEDVLAIMRDYKTASRIARAAKTAILSYTKLRYHHHVGELVGEIAAAARVTHGAQRTAKIRAQTQRYEAVVNSIEPGFWVRRRSLDRIRAAAVRLGMRRIKRFVSGGAA